MSGDRIPILLWDAINGCREEAKSIDPFTGVEVSLIEYAEEDHDGLCDGLYIEDRTNTPNPHPFIVEYSDGTRETWYVYGELSVDFRADRVKNKEEKSVDHASHDANTLRQIENMLEAVGPDLIEAIQGLMGARDA